MLGALGTSNLYTRFANHPGVDMTATCIVQARPLEKVLADELEQHLEPLEASSQVGPDGWIGVFNQMLINLWQRLK